jgi:carbon storage regulator
VLVLSRKVGEKIHIADNVVIQVIEIKDGKARIGIMAPRDVAVHRGEVFEAIKRTQGGLPNAKPESPTN